MKTTKVIETLISETNIYEVSNLLNTSERKRIAICNANTLVKCRDPEIKNVINSFTINLMVSLLQKLCLS